MKCKVKVIKEILDLFPECRPEVGKVYDADYSKGNDKKIATAVIDVNGKRIIVRKGEFVVVEG